jgi:hypothetical protein
MGNGPAARGPWAPPQGGRLRCDVRDMSLPPVDTMGCLTVKRPGTPPEIHAKDIN